MAGNVGLVIHAPTRESAAATVTGCDGGPGVGPGRLRAGSLGNGDDMMTTTSSTPRAWVGCLACYNAGRLVGEWVDGVEAGGYVPCQMPGHEEFHVFDHEGYGAALSGECSPAEAQDIAEWLDEVDEDDRGAFAAFLGDQAPSLSASWTLADVVRAFRDQYLGTEEGADEVDALAERLTNVYDEDELPEWARPYTWELLRNVARDALLSGDFTVLHVGGREWAVFDNRA